VNNETIILTTAYLPPIQYLAKFLSYQNVVIEINESYSKQSYRNRCTILSCNGPLSLSIPVVKTYGNNTLTKDIKIDYSINWQKNHWKAIESAYRTSAYFEFIADVISPYYTKKEQFLIDLNDKITDEILTFMGVSKLMMKSSEFLKEQPEGVADFRNRIHPKTKYQLVDENFSPVKYFQIFDDRYQFYPNLSIIDLLFNEGLDSLSVIEDSIKK